jgi:hypothetical protein
MRVEEPLQSAGFLLGTTPSDLPSPALLLIRACKWDSGCTEYSSLQICLEAVAILLSWEIILLIFASHVFIACLQRDRSSGDGGPAQNARLNVPMGLASAANAPDGLGSWLICASRSCLVALLFSFTLRPLHAGDSVNNRVRRHFSNGTIVTVVGNGSATAGADGLRGKR